jgi:hypothetical protein
VECIRVDRDIVRARHAVADPVGRGIICGLCGEGVMYIVTTLWIIVFALVLYWLEIRVEIRRSGLDLVQAHDICTKQRRSSI